MDTQWTKIAHKVPSINKLVHVMNNEGILKKRTTDLHSIQNTIKKKL